jgi:hypothetical protein
MATDAELIRHQQRLNDVGDRLTTMQLQGESRAERLSDVHRQVSHGFAELRHAFGDDWRRIRHDAQAGWRDLMKEMSAADATAIGFHDEQLATFDEWLDSISDELEALHRDDQESLARRLRVDAGGAAELRAQIAAARARRQAIVTAPPAERQLATDQYATAVRRISDEWQRLNRR